MKTCWIFERIEKSSAVLNFVRRLESVKCKNDEENMTPRITNKNDFDDQRNSTPMENFVLFVL